MAILYQHHLDRIFHALGDGTRRQMLSLLSEGGELSASGLAKSFDIAQPTASKHIKVLEKAKLVRRKVQGRTHYFRLNPETLSEAEAWIHRHRAFWLGSLKKLEQLVNTEGDAGERQ